MSDLSQSLQKVLAGRYRIERELGRGGMATVLLADDLKHRRRVAIKVLDPETRGAIGPERFLREIETVSSLTHPHILPLYDSGEADGLLFYVMPYVEEGSLRHRLGREGLLPVDEALRITREIAGALAHAHRAGVVHRDIKPENVLLEAGHAVVADFGLAFEPEAAHRLTTLGVTVGTPAYMSPEQAAGSSRVDGRSDQYALACVLYEMLAGQPPFTGPSAQSVMYQHLNAEPRPVTDLRPATPAGVREALARALAKQPADRYATMAEFAQALGAPELGATPRPAAVVESAPTLEMAVAPASSTAPAVPSPAPSTSTTPAGARRGRRALVPLVGVLVVVAGAVMVWKVFGPKPAAAPVRKNWILVAAFDGPPADSSTAVAARALICAAIDQSKSVATVPREQISAALAAAGKPPGTRLTPEVARELAYRSAVRTVLEGSVDRIGSGYSVVLRVVNADSANVILTEQGTARDADALIPALGDLAQKLRRGMGENRLALAATRPMAFVATPSLAAYKLYLRAQTLTGMGDNLQALAAYRAALALDPDFAGAWWGMASTYYNLGYPDSVVMACDEALRRGDRLSDDMRMHIRASRMEADGDWEGAAGIYDRALIEDPNNMWALNATRADLMWHLGRYEDALERERRLGRLQPFRPSGVHYLNQAVTLQCLGRLGEARQVADSIPGVWHLPVAAYCALFAGDYAAADSLAELARKDPQQQIENVGGPELISSAICRMRGQIAKMDSLDARFWKLAEDPQYGWNDRARLYRYSMVFAVQCLDRKPPPPPTTTLWPETTAVALVTRGLRAAYFGDGETARRCLQQAKARPRRERTPEGPAFVLLEAAIAGADCRWSDVVTSLQPIAVQRYIVGNTGGDDMAWIRWTLADAYEKLGRPDSAAVNLERITCDPVTPNYHPYASLRLVSLYAKLGRAADARRQWALASRAFTKSDPPVSMKMDAARAALATTP